MKTKKYKCCNKPQYLKAYVWFWPFKAKYCINCQVAISDTGWFLDFIWTYFVWPFWDGRVKVCITREKED